MEFCKEESLVLRLSMQSQLVGTQTFLFVNYVFRNDSNTEGVAAPAMMQINETKV